MCSASTSTRCHDSSRADAEFNQFYPVAEFDEGAYDCIVVSAAPATFGSIFRLSYSLGDPPLRIADAHFLAANFTRWLAIHVEAWEIYSNDWREGVEHFERLIGKERRSD